MCNNIYVLRRGAYPILFYIDYVFAFSKQHMTSGVLSLNALNYDFEVQGKRSKTV